jgi:pantoate--beta-alanine ligase
MGQKDFQQSAIVQHMIKHFDLPVEFVICPTMREPDGLAMSSRNRLLDPDLRIKASIIFKTLQRAKQDINSRPIDDVRNDALKTLSIPNFKPEYFEIADGTTLLPVEDHTQHNIVVVCCAVWAGDVRLIDNVIIREN